MEEKRTDIYITILTPTYNRAYTLTRLYESLLRQTNKSFQWMIIDDGSIDETESIVKGFEADFEIVYIKKENGGKHTAINEGIRHIHTEYTFIVDSDDFLTDDAIEKVYRWTETILGVAGVAGVAGVGANNDHKIIGGYPNNVEYIDCFNTERRRYKLLGDKAEIYKTELLRQNPFPEYEGEKFCPETVVWNKLSLDGYKIRWFRDIIKICEYLPDGLTSKTHDMDFFKKNFNGYKKHYQLCYEAMFFPDNYSAISVYYARCRLINREKGCLEGIEGNWFRLSMIRIIGFFRCVIRRY